MSKVKIKCYWQLLCVQFNFNSNKQRKVIWKLYLNKMFHFNGSCIWIFFFYIKMRVVICNIVVSRKILFNHI